MERYAVIGHPVTHSLSPVIHAAFAAQTGRDLHYCQMNVAPSDLADAVRQFRESGGRGLNVTLPHKEAALQLAQQIRPRARAAGAANWLAFQDDAVVADNTDGSGLVRDLTGALGLDLSAMRILLLGAGGAARGILPPLCACGPKSLTVANRTPARARALVAQQDAGDFLQACGLDELEDGVFDLILHATAAGVSGAPLDLPAAILDSKRSVCYDLMYGSDSRFLDWARRAGCACACDGLGMLIEQAAESFSLWHGVRPDTAEVRRRLGAAAMPRTA